jgi:2-methylcitrate dehydratase PrpD
MKKTESSVSRELAQWVSSLQYKDLNAEIIRYAKRYLLDALAVAWAGSRAMGTEGAHAWVTAQGGKAESRVWLTNEYLPATSAAFINGIYAAALDFDSVHDQATSHPDIVIIPALMALADRQPMHGKDFLTAYIAGAEMHVRLCMGITHNPGWFMTSTLGVFASAAISARVLGLDVNGIHTAMGIALSRAAGTQQSLVEGALVKRLQSAFAARDGVEAAFLAQCGITAPKQMFEGERGFDNLYEPLDRARTLGGLGQSYLLQTLTLKNYPSCFCNHAAIVATEKLVAQHQLTIDQLSGCTVRITPYMNRLVGAQFSLGDSPQVAAQFSVQYSIASILLRGSFRLQDIDTDAVLDPAVMECIQKIKIEIDQTESGKFTPATVIIQTKAGELLSCTVNEIPGTPAQPLDDTQVRAKAMTCLTSGPYAMTEAQACKLIARIDAIDQLENMQDFWNLA